MAAEHPYELERTARSVNPRRNRNGTYFQRMVAWPGPKGELNQLEQVVRRLRLARDLGRVQGDAYDIGIAMPTDDIAVPVRIPGVDGNTRTFPRLSHLSFSLQCGAVHLSAMYRSHDVISRAYGDYAGLGRLLGFVAQQSGHTAGELTCVAASATAEVDRGGCFGIERVRSLLAECRAALEATP